MNITKLVETPADKFNVYVIQALKARSYAPHLWVMMLDEALIDSTEQALRAKLREVEAHPTTPGSRTFYLKLSDALAQCELERIYRTDDEADDEDD